MAFIVIEGIDRCGKSTLCRSLSEKFSNDGKTVLNLSFPDRTTSIGKKINGYLMTGLVEGEKVTDEEVHLMFTDNRFELMDVIKTAIDEGKIIVCDRYMWSGIAYSTAKGLNYEWCIESQKDLPSPTLIVYIDISPQIASERGGYGSEIYEKLDFQEKVHTAFGYLRFEASFRNEKVLTVDGNCATEIMVEEIINFLE